MKHECNISVEIRVSYILDENKIPQCTLTAHHSWLLNNQLKKQFMLFSAELILIESLQLY